MGQYFDNTFFRFFFGFLGILLMSLILLMATNHFANKADEAVIETKSDTAHSSSFVETSSL